MAVVWTTRTLTAVGPDIRACCPGMVAAEGFRRSALVEELSLRKANVHRKFYIVYNNYKNVSINYIFNVCNATPAIVQYVLKYL